MPADKLMLSAMTTKAEAKKAVQRLRKAAVGSKFQNDLNLIADSLDGLVDGAAELGSKGGSARAKKLSPKRRKEIAKLAASKRWYGRE